MDTLYEKRRRARATAASRAASRLTGPNKAKLSPPRCPVHGCEMTEKCETQYLTLYGCPVVRCLNVTQRGMRVPR